MPCLASGWWMMHVSFRAFACLPGGYFLLGRCIIAVPGIFPMVSRFPVCMERISMKNGISQ